MTHPVLEAQLDAYLDGELTADDARESRGFAHAGPPRRRGLLGPAHGEAVVQRPARLFAASVRLLGTRISPRRRAARLPERAAGRGARVWAAPAPDQRVPLARGARPGGRAPRRYATGLPPAPLDDAGVCLLGGVRPGNLRAARLRRAARAQ